MGRGSDNSFCFTFCSHQHISQMAIEEVGPKESNCFSSGVRTIFLWKPIAICDFSIGVQPLFAPTPRYAYVAHVRSLAKVLLYAYRRTTWKSI